MRNKMFQKRYATRKELIAIIDEQIEDMRNRLNNINHGNLPKKNDFRGWELYGKIKALIWVKLTNLENKRLTKYLNTLATADNNDFKKPCPECGGKGIFKDKREGAMGVIQCSYCQGQGFIKS